MTGSNVSAGNFLHNAGSYGVDFLIGQVHPVLLTLLAMLGLAVIYQREKKVAGLLAGWLLILSLTYFSMWLQNYGETTDMFSKTRLFIFFYPPLVLCGACGLVWVADTYAGGNKTLAAAVLCAVMMGWSILYYKHYPSGSDKFVLEMRLVDQVGGMVTTHDMLVACRPEVFTGVRSSAMATTDIEWFLQEPSWRREAFQKARKVYLVDDMVAQRECQRMVSVIKERGQAVLVKQWIQGKTRYAVYSLSRF